MSESFHHFLWHAWDWDISKIIGCLGLLVAFYFWNGLKPLWRFSSFVAGVLILFISLASPLDALSDEYLFSAHMLQHFLLLMIVPPLLILGLPKQASRRVLDIPWVQKTERFFHKPIRVWIVANLVLWVWHIPIFYDWAIGSEPVHIFEHLTFLVSATVFWWLVLAPVKNLRLPFAPSMIYLFFAGLSNMLLGIILTFEDKPLYTPYLRPEDSWKILTALRNDFHLDPLADQKLGGALMWILGGVVFLFVILLQLGQWYQSETMSEPDAKEILVARTRV